MPEQRLDAELLNTKGTDQQLNQQCNNIILKGHIQLRYKSHQQFSSEVADMYCSNCSNSLAPYPRAAAKAGIYSQPYPPQVVCGEAPAISSSLARLAMHSQVCCLVIGLTL